RASQAWSTTVLRWPIAEIRRRSSACRGCRDDAFREKSVKGIDVTAIAGGARVGCHHDRQGEGRHDVDHLPSIAPGEVDRMPARGTHEPAIAVAAPAPGRDRARGPTALDP